MWTKRIMWSRVSRYTMSMWSRVSRWTRRSMWSRGSSWTKRFRCSSGSRCTMRTRWSRWSRWTMRSRWSRGSRQTSRTRCYRGWQWTRRIRWSRKIRWTKRSMWGEFMPFRPGCVWPVCRFVLIHSLFGRVFASCLYSSMKSIVILPPIAPRIAGCQISKMTLGMQPCVVCSV